MPQSPLSTPTIPLRGQKNDNSDDQGPDQEIGGDNGTGDDAGEP
jgi:hypothetical protein